MSDYPKCKVCGRECIGTARWWEWVCLSCAVWAGHTLINEFIVACHIPREYTPSMATVRKFARTVVNSDFYGTIKVT